MTKTTPTGRLVSVDIESYDLRRRTPDGSPVTPAIVMRDGDAPVIVCDLSALEKRIIAWYPSVEKPKRKSKGWRRHVRRLKSGDRKWHP